MGAVDFTRKNQRRKKLLTRASLLSILAYNVPVVIIFLLRITEAIDTPWKYICILYVYTWASWLLLHVVISIKKEYTDLFVDTIYLLELANWFITWVFYTVLLQDLRSISLFCAFMVYIFLLSQAGFRFSLLFTFLIFAVYEAVVYVSISVLGQEGSLLVEFVYALNMLLGGLVAAYTAGLFKKQRDELKQFQRDLTKEQQKVKEKSESLEVAMEKLMSTNEYISNANRRYERDLQLASLVQQGLIPSKMSVDSWDVKILSRPASIVSGDFYDVYIKENDDMGVVLCDVSGHGVSSALVTMLAKPILYQNFGKVIRDSLGEKMREANRQLIDTMGGIDKYMTAVAVCLKNDLVSISNAGHPAVMVKRKSGGIEKVAASGTFLGISGLESDYEHEDFVVAPGDFVVAYTDALYETKNDAGSEFGEKRILEVLERDFSTAGDVAEALRDALYEFTNGAFAEDDLTIIACMKK